jgi:hypothetical protein
MGGVGGTGEGSVDGEEDMYIKEECIKVEEAADIKDEFPQAIAFPPTKTEPEVRLWGVCVVGAVVAYRPCITP